MKKRTHLSQSSVSLEGKLDRPEKMTSDEIQ
jgi:hypothetical protein